MEKYGEIEIIHGREDYVESLYFKGFIKWIGLPYLDFTYNEKVERLNRVLDGEQDKFSLVLYINDVEQKWEERYCVEQNKKHRAFLDKKFIWMNEQLDPQWLIRFGSCLDFLDARLRYNLVDIYCRNGLMKWLSVSAQAAYTGNYTETRRCWEQVIRDLELIQHGASMLPGYEHLQYAELYSKQRLNDLCLQYRRIPPYDSQELCRAAEKIQEEHPGFYMVENLKAKMVSKDILHRRNSIAYMYNCAHQCRVDVCDSFYYYRLGKQYELNHFREKADKSFRIAYRKYTLNFRALFKLAVNSHVREDIDGEEKYLMAILDILQMNRIEEGGPGNISSLPPLELDYAVKCYILLGNIEYRKRDNPVKAGFYYEKAKEICDSLDENDFLKCVFQNINLHLSVVKNVRERLRARIIEQKIEDSRQNKKYREWRRINEEAESE